MVLNGISFPGRLYHSNQTSYPWKYAAWSHLFLQYNSGLLISGVHCLKFSTYLIFTLLLLAIASLVKRKGYGLIRNQHSSVWNIPSFAIKTITVTASTGKCALSTQHSPWKSWIIHANQAACKAVLRMTLVGDRCWGGNNMSPVTCRWHKTPN